MDDSKLSYKILTWKKFFTVRRRPNTVHCPLSEKLTVDILRSLGPRDRGKNKGGYEGMALHGGEVGSVGGRMA